MKGKSIFLWPATDVLEKDFNNDMDAMVQALVDAGMDWVIVKFMNYYNQYNKGMDLLGFREKLRDAGIKMWGYHYVYPQSVYAQYVRGVRRAKELSLDGVVLDAEGEFKGYPREASSLASNYRKNLPSEMPLALSSYRIPSYHPKFPFKEFLNHCQLNMTQHYWLGATNPREQLIRSMDEFDKIMPGQKIVPIGLAYSEHGYPPPQKSEMDEFDNAVKEFDLGGLSWWNYRQALNKRTNDNHDMLMIDVIKAHEWNSPAPQPDPPPVIDIPAGDFISRQDHLNLINQAEIKGKVEGLETASLMIKSLSININEIAEDIKPV